MKRSGIFAVGLCGIEEELAFYKVPHLYSLLTIVRHRFFEPRDQKRQSINILTITPKFQISIYIPVKQKGIKNTGNSKPYDPNPSAAGFLEPYRVQAERYVDILVAQPELRQDL